MENFFIQREGTECSTILSSVPSYSVRTLPPITNRKIVIGVGAMSPTRQAIQELRYHYLPLAGEQYIHRVGRQRNGRLSMSTATVHSTAPQNLSNSVIKVGVVKMKEKVNHSAPRGVISRNGDVSFTSTQEWN